MSGGMADGDVLAVARQLKFNLGPHRDRLQAADATLDFAALRRDLDALTAAGAPDIIDPPSHWRAPPQCRETLARLEAAIARIRAAGVVAFQAPEHIAQNVLCSAANPVIYYDLERALEASRPANHLNASDVDWPQRTRIADLSHLRSLRFEHLDVGFDPFAIALDRLGELEVLDLTECGLASVPDEVAGALSLRWISLSLNPVRDVSLLEGLPRLAFVSAVRTRVPPARLASLRARCRRELRVRPPRCVEPTRMGAAPRGRAFRRQAACSEPKFESRARGRPTGGQ